MTYNCVGHRGGESQTGGCTQTERQKEEKVDVRERFLVASKVFLLAVARCFLDLFNMTLYTHC